MNILYTFDLTKNNFRIKSYDNGIAYNEFTPISKHKMLNKTVKSENDVDLLKNLNVKNKMIECLNDDISNLIDKNEQIKQSKRELKHKYNVCTVYDSCFYFLQTEFITHIIHKIHLTYVDIRY